MKLWPLFSLCVIILFGCSSPKKPSIEELTTPFEQKENYSATYEESIEYYKKLQDFFPKNISIEEVGESDAGKLIYKVVIAENLTSPKTKKDGSDKLVMLINNAIHAGEPCGVDASMMLARDILMDDEKRKLLEDITLVIIPIYNVGGALRRNSTTRANQNGPAEYGFRGNAQNLDLNRDFIKMDSKNARTFVRLFSDWMPDIFVDTHTSNGADYQYTLTLLPTFHEKLPKPLDDFLSLKMLPSLYKQVDEAGWLVCPYVMSYGTPDKGILGFYDSPRYSSGYASLFNCLSFTTEAHMLKPFADRVNSTYSFLDELLKFSFENKSEIKKAKAESEQLLANQQEFVLDWKLDFSRFDSIPFKGYEAKYKTSEITGKQRLYYDREAPFEKKIAYFNYYSPTVKVTKPKAYIIPQVLRRVVNRMKDNNVQFSQLKKDSLIDVELYEVLSFETAKKPYEGHIPHSKVEVNSSKVKKQFYAGDYLVLTNQSNVRYIIETLEPQAKDAFFVWNFFDSFMQRKEYFSGYVFEDYAAQFLRENPAFQKEFEEKKDADTSFDNSASKQLMFIYDKSPLAEGTNNVYPIGRILN